MISRAGKFRFIISKKKYYQDLEVINNLIGGFISLTLRMTPEELESRKKSDKKYTFLHELALFTRDPKVIRDQIIAVLLAGRDTTAGTLSWIIYELARHPDCLVKLRREILETVGPTKPQPTKTSRTCPTSEPSSTRPSVCTLPSRSTSALLSRIRLSLEAAGRRLGAPCCPQRHARLLLDVGDAAPSRPAPRRFGRLRRRVSLQPRTLVFVAPQASRIHPLQCWPAHLHRPAVCADGDELRPDSNVPAV